MTLTKLIDALFGAVVITILAFSGHIAGLLLIHIVHIVTSQHP